TEREQSTWNVNRQVQRGARDEFFIVEIPNMRSRRTARNAAHNRRRCDADRAEEGRKFQCHTSRKLTGSRLLIQTNQLESRVRKVFGKGAGARDESTHAIWMKKLDRLYMDLETVTRFSTIDVDGPCQWMRTWSAFGDRAFHIFE